MKSLLNFALLLFLGQMVLAQEAKYPIPGATEQPQWSFPLFFEDGEGARDTVWIGYDPVASQDLTIVDTQFNEYQRVDSSTFNAIFQKNHNPKNIPVKPNYHFKAIIENYFQSYGTIYFIKGIFPIKIWWDESLFYPDSSLLANTDVEYLENAPSIRLDMRCFNGNNRRDCGLLPYAGDPPIIISDSTYNFFNKTRVHTDSVLFTVDTTINAPAILAEKALKITIGISPFFKSYVNFSEFSTEQIKIFPNPVNNRLQIKNLPIFSNIILSDTQGRQLLKTSNKDNFIIFDLQDIGKGIYSLILKNDNFYYTQKIIVL